MAGAVANTVMEKFSSAVVEKIFQEVKVVTGFKEDFQVLCEELDSIKSLLKDMGGKFSHRSMSNWNLKLEDFVYEAMAIVEECREAGQSCNPLFRSRNFHNPIFRYRVGSKIKILKEKISKIHGSAKFVKYLAFSSIIDLNARVSYGSQDLSKTYTSLVSESEAVGIEGELKVIRGKLLDEDTRLIAICGMGGQGKTHLLRRLEGEQRVRKRFDLVVWTEVTQKFDSQQLLVHIADKIGLSVVKDCKEAELQNKIREHVEARKQMLLDNLAHCCLFVLDDVWQTETFEQLGLPLNHCKIVITTRHRKVAEAMKNHYSDQRSFIHEKGGLSPSDSLKLFSILAFPERQEHVPPENLMDFAVPIVEKFAGHPLAIKTVARSMCKARLPNEWERTLDGLNGKRTLTRDPLAHEVTPCLRLSYETLPDHLKACFLYFSSFPKGTIIQSEYLVYGWIAQGFVCTRVAEEEPYELGCSYMDELVDRCLVEVSKVGGDGRAESCRIHDLFHDLVLSESQKQSKCLLKEEPLLTKLPVENWNDFRGICLARTRISEIKEAIPCPRVRTVILSNNLFLKSISARFFNNLTYLTVLDLSKTTITSLPGSIKNAKNLKFLNLSQTNIENLPESLSGLKRLQFLDVSECQNLKRLHSRIDKHQFMLHLNMNGCPNIELFPVGISKLTCLHTLKGVTLRRSTTGNAKALQLRHLKELIGLEHLLTIYPEDLVTEPTGDEVLDASSSEDGTFGLLTNMRTLSFKNQSERILRLPKDMKRMKRLESICLYNCELPQWIIKLENLVDLELREDSSHEEDYKGIEEIPNLKTLHLSNNDNCVRFPEEFGKCKAFPKLENLKVTSFQLLESFPPLHDGAMPLLKRLELLDCDKMEEMPRGLERLQKLEEVKVRICLNNLQAAEDFRNDPGWKNLIDRKIKRELKMFVKNPN